MGLGATTYSAVTWTTGDTVTEAKLDSMVGNDQAYDSHAAQGLLLNNNTGYYQKVAGGTNTQLLNVTGSDVLEVGATTVPISLRGKWNGWNAIGDTWTYASATTINVPAGSASYYAVGDKIKFTQTSVKYFYIVGVADTLLTVTGGSDYTVANAAITDVYVSKMESPVGFPGRFDYTPAETGWSSTTILLGSFSIHGRDVIARLRVSGTSDTTGASLSLPVTAATITDGRWGGVNEYADDNGVDITVASKWLVLTAGTTVAFYKDMKVAAWTASGTKAISALISYQI